MVTIRFGGWFWDEPAQTSPEAILGIPKLLISTKCGLSKSPGKTTVCKKKKVSRIETLKQIEPDWKFSWVRLHVFLINYRSIPVVLLDHLQLFLETWVCCQWSKVFPEAECIIIIRNLYMKNDLRMSSCLEEPIIKNLLGLRTSDGHPLVEDLWLSRLTRRSPLQWPRWWPGLVPIFCSPRGSQLTLEALRSGAGITLQFTGRRWGDQQLRSSNYLLGLKNHLIISG